jgi:hypothetical protein
LPARHIQSTRERTPSSFDLKHLNTDTILRKGFPERRWRRKSELLPQPLRWNEFPVSTRQAQLKLVNKIVHRGMSGYFTLSARS